MVFIDLMGSYGVRSKANEIVGDSPKKDQE
jgi:hypothetical protein